MKEDETMNYVLAFGLGTVFGALAGTVVALLFAPTSGEELRTNIKTKADAEYAKLQDEFQQGVQQLQTQVDKMSNELQTISSRSKETSQPA
jgi:gas vesicle protein